MRTKIKLHGALGEQMGRSEWSLCVDSASEAIHAINNQTDKKLYKQFAKNDKSNIKYRVLIDGEDFVSPKKLNNNLNDKKLMKEDLETIQSSELIMNKKIKRIDLNIAICIRESFQNGYLQPKDFYPKGTQEVWWECKQCGHDWKREIKQVEAG